MREREAFFKDLCQRKDKEYQDLAYVQTQGIEECQRLREENAVMVKELELARNLSKTAIDRKDSELTSLSMALQQKIDENSTLKNELRKIGGGIDKNTITILQTELEKVRGELEEKENAIAKLKSELEVRGDIQLNLFPPESTPTPEPEIIPTPEPESENTESPAVNSEPLTVTPTEVVQTVPLLLLDTIEGTVSVGGLMKHIRDMKKDNPNFPDPPEKTQTFTDAVTGKTNRLGELEKLYGFKLAGYVLKGKSREYRYKILDN